MKVKVLHSEIRVDHFKDTRKTKYMIALETTSILQKSRSTFQTCGNKQITATGGVPCIDNKIILMANLSACLVMSRTSEQGQRG